MHFLCSFAAEKMYRVIEIDIQYHSIICYQLLSLLYIFALPYALLAWSLVTTRVFILRLPSLPPPSPF